MKKKMIWYLVATLILGLALLAVACAGSAEETPAKPAAPAPAAPAAPTVPVPTAPPGAIAPTTPKAIHEAAFAATPPGCTSCHTVGGAGVGATGGLGLPGPEAGPNDHTDRTKATPLQCKTCHQLSS